MTERDSTEPGTAAPADEADPGVQDAAAPRAPDASGPADAPDAPDASPDADRPVEIGGQKGPEPTRYGDWEGRGRCTDF